MSQICKSCGLEILGNNKITFGSCPACGGEMCSFCSMQKRAEEYQIKIHNMEKLLRVKTDEKRVAF